MLSTSPASLRKPNLMRKFYILCNNRAGNNVRYRFNAAKIYKAVEECSRHQFFMFLAHVPSLIMTFSAARFYLDSKLSIAFQIGHNDVGVRNTFGGESSNPTMT